MMVVQLSHLLGDPALKCPPRGAIVVLDSEDKDNPNITNITSVISKINRLTGFKASLLQARHPVKLKITR